MNTRLGLFVDDLDILGCRDTAHILLVMNLSILYEVLCGSSLTSLGKVLTLALLLLIRLELLSEVIKLFLIILCIRVRVKIFHLEIPLSFTLIYLKSQSISIVLV